MSENRQVLSSGSQCVQKIRLSRARQGICGTYRQLLSRIETILCDARNELQFIYQYCATNMQIQPNDVYESDQVYGIEI